MASNVSVLTLPKVRAEALLIIVAPPVRFTVPPNQFPMLVSEIAPVPALKVLLPAMVSAPFCMMKPRLLVADRLPVTAVVPKTNAPVLVAVNVPALTVPKFSPAALVICVVPPVRFTAPPNELLALVSVMAFVPALIVVSPPIDNGPDCPSERVVVNAKSLPVLIGPSAAMLLLLWSSFMLPTALPVRVPAVRLPQVWRTSPNDCRLIWPVPAVSVPPSWTLPPEMAIEPPVVVPDASMLPPRITAASDVI